MSFERKNIRLGSDNYLGQRVFFVTICSHRRKTIFAEASLCEWLVHHLRQSAAQHRFGVHAYCIMPDHLHLLAGGLSAESNLLAFVNAFKQRTAYEHRKERRAWLWQFKFYDHILRPNDAAEQVAWYVWLNPVRKGMCKQPEDYPFSGSFTMDWKRKKRISPVWSPPWK